MENNIKEAVAQTVAFWAQHISPFDWQKPKMAEFEAKKAVALEELARQLEAEFPFHPDGRVVCISHSMPGKYLQAAFEASFGFKEGDVNPWPKLTVFMATETTATCVKAGNNVFGTTPLEPLWVAP